MQRRSLEGRFICKFNEATNSYIRSRELIWGFLWLFEQRKEKQAIHRKLIFTLQMKKSTLTDFI